MNIDLNCDLGEGCPHDAELMSLITSANIACGGHAGDMQTALSALNLAGQLGVQVGAHPGFLDREHFGRRELDLPEDHIIQEVSVQVGALVSWAELAGVRVRYVKPHGALYNMACRADAVARPVIAVVEAFNLALMGLPGSRLEALSAGRCPFIAEGFADRRYRPDGSLVPRSQSDAFVENADEAVQQAELLLRKRGVRTLCVHGDNPRAVEFVRAHAAGAPGTRTRHPALCRAMNSPHAVLTLLSPGMYTLVVDHGRPRWRSLGVPVGGAADRFALAIGNALVGNPPDAAALEISLVGPTLQSDAPLACVLHGAPFAISSDRQTLSAGTTFTLQPGEYLRIGGTPRQMRGYFCVRGSFDVPVVLGSRSSLAPLKAGDQLGCRAGTIAGRSVESERFATLFDHPLRVVPGVQDDWFPPKILEGALAQRGSSRSAPPATAWDCDFAASQFLSRRAR